MRIEKIDVGTVLRDMHGWNWDRDQANLQIEEKHQITDVIRVDMPNAGDIIQGMVQGRLGDRSFHYTNKLLVVIDKDYQSGSVTILKAAWSFDDRAFGLMRIKVST